MNIIRPIITEKTLKQAEELNQYCFLVDKDVNKVEIAKSVSTQFKVKVEKVRTVINLGKTFLSGTKRRVSRKSNFKKAIVTLKPGDNIEVFKLK